MRGYPLASLSHSNGIHTETMRLLHTSDWHLGGTICGKKRYDEHEKFLTWLAGRIRDERIDTLVVAGDIFDSGTPSNRALELYYRFLGGIAGSGCRHIVIIAGNHDSPSLLGAPRELLSALHIQVIGSVSDDITEQIFILDSAEGEEEIIICAVPYLRDRDIRIAQAGESIDEKHDHLLKGIRAHYHGICAAALTWSQERGGHLPIVATGHLFAAGGRTPGDDGVRDVAIGNLLQVGTDAFPPCIRYLALGHLHQPQLVGGREDRRYCGAPLPMGFGETGCRKEVILVEITREGSVNPEPIPVPVFREFRRISGDTGKVEEELTNLVFQGREVCVEVEITGAGAGRGLREMVQRITRHSPVEVLRVKSSLSRLFISPGDDEPGSLDELTPMDVFERCLETGNVPCEGRKELVEAYQEILTEVLEEDTHAE